MLETIGAYKITSNDGMQKQLNEPMAYLQYQEYGTHKKEWDYKSSVKTYLLQSRMLWRQVKGKAATGMGHQI